MNCRNCTRELMAGTGPICPTCLGRTREALAEITALHAALHHELTDHAGASRPPGTIGPPTADGIPPALTLMASGAPGGIIPTRYGNRDHAADQWDTDPPSVHATLTSWEDDWRHRAGHTPRTTNDTVPATAAYLDRNLTWAARDHPAITDFITEIHTLLHHLRAATRAGEATEHGVPCTACGHTLTRRYTNPRPCHHPQRFHGPWLLTRDTRIGQIRRDPHCDHSDDDPQRWPCRGSNTCGCEQGGRRDTWICSNRDCQLEYEPGQYTLAVWEHWDRQQRPHPGWPQPAIPPLD